MENEIWKDIPGYESLYQASNMGVIKSLCYYGHKGKIGYLQPKTNKDGYKCVNLNKNGIRKMYMLQQLIAMAFLDHVPNGREIVVRHKNDIKSDNKLSNLVLGTPRDNSNDYYSKIERNLPRGVYKHNNIYKSRASIKGKNTYLGSYKTPAEAAEAYQKALNNIKTK
jgi:hypothetical protein